MKLMLNITYWVVNIMQSTTQHTIVTVIHVRNRKKSDFNTSEHFINCDGF